MGPGPRAFLRHQGARMRQGCLARQPSPLRRLFPSCSRSALRPATTTRSRPSPFAWYIAASALAMSSSGVSPCVGYSAAPTLTVTRPPPNSSAATRARRRSPTAAAVAIGASVSMTRNSSPPSPATPSTPRVGWPPISAIVPSPASRPTRARAGGEPRAPPPAGLTDAPRGGHPPPPRPGGGAPPPQGPDDVLAVGAPVFHGTAFAVEQFLRHRELDAHQVRRADTG